MDNYFPVVRKASSRQEPQSGKTRYQPYSLSNKTEESSSKLYQFRKQLQHTSTKPSSSALTKLNVRARIQQLKELKLDPDFSLSRTDRVVSIATGHQVAETRRIQKPYLEDRRRKLAIQQCIEPKNTEPQVLSNVRIFIDGFLENTTDIEMKTIIIRAGGQVVPSASGCTHILTSQQLSGSKTHKLLTGKSKCAIYVVKPEWVLDSVKVGKRRPERLYSILKKSNTKVLYDMLQK